MRVSIRSIPHREDEQVILECVEMTKDFEDVREYALMRGNMLAVFVLLVFAGVSLIDWVKGSIEAEDLNRRLAQLQKEEDSK